MKKGQLVCCTFALIVVLAVVLAGCGTNTNGTSAGGVSADPTATYTTVKGYGTAVGCPSDAVVNPVPSAPNVIITLKQDFKTVNVQTGQVVEVHLPFGLAWEGPNRSQGLLQLQTPSGYALKDRHVCVWRFIAHNVGMTKLSFSGRAICKPNVMCPLFILEVAFTIDVK
jgi:hypothetical protein